MIFSDNKDIRHSYYKNSKIYASESIHSLPG